LLKQVWSSATANKKERQTLRSWRNPQPNIHLHPKATLLAKVYFIASRFDVKLQADNLVRWDVAVRLNHKQKTQKEREKHGIQIHRRRMGKTRE